MEHIVIGVDAMGGDGAPNAVIEGCALAAREFDDIDFRLYGDIAQIEPLLTDELKSRSELVNCLENISMHDEPMLAVRRKKNSSIVMGLNDARNKVVNAFVSAGSTGALFLGGMAYVRVLPSIDRPALAPILPGDTHPVMLIDSGANADCQPRYLSQFGLMGSVYMNRVMSFENPRVGLINIGAEAEKGSKLYKEAYALMSEQQAYNFAGNCEARDVHSGKFDVCVCDGFTGNVILKYAEGFSGMIFKEIKRTIADSRRNLLGGVLLKPAFTKLKRRMNSDEYGGAPLLGLDGAIVKAHGSSGGYAFSRALAQARDIVRSDVVGRIREGLKNINPA